MMLSDRDKKDLATLVMAFPSIFEKAQVDFAKFKIGYAQGLFKESQVDKIMDWYSDFPKLWNELRPNFVYTRTAKGTMIPIYNTGFASKVDLWIDQLPAEISSYGLGIAPLIIAGILIAGALGVAGAIWAVAYIKRQAVISKLIDEVTAGRIPLSVLETELSKGTGSPLGVISDAMKWVTYGLASYFLIPVIGDFLSGNR